MDHLILKVYTSLVNVRGTAKCFEKFSLFEFMRAQPTKSWGEPRRARDLLPEEALEYLRNKAKATTAVVTSGDGVVYICENFPMPQPFKENDTWDVHIRVRAPLAAKVEEIPPETKLYVKGSINSEC